MKTVVADPPVRADDKCAECGKRRPDRAVAERDPFCSSTCARAHHGCALAYSGASRWGPSDQPCSECGGELDEQTPGCKKCGNRHYARRKKARAGAGAK